MTDKSPDAFRTISEVADDLDLPQHVLRFWETRFSQIKPLKRGGGRRYYRPSDVDLLRGIRHLLYEEGCTIKGAQKILRENGVQFAIAIGAGDLSALEEMARRNAEARALEAQASENKVEASQKADSASARAADEPGDAGSDADVLVGQARARSRGLFGLGGRGGEAGAGDAGTDLSRDNRTLLQEALFDLLECKRLLDQAR